MRNSIISLSQTSYLKFILIFVPLLNFLPGVNIDLFSPSLPSIAIFFDVSSTIVKNTITVNILSFGIGCLLFGALSDIFGRRKIILFGLLTYFIVSVIAIFSHTITQLIILRAIQGFAVSTLSFGCRAIIGDTFTGHDYSVAILYSSLSFAIGPIIAPFIGGLLQHYFGWHANFVAYAVLAGVMFLLFWLLVRESLVTPQAKSVKKIIKNYVTIITNKTFFMGCIIMTGSFLATIFYNTAVPFLVERVLHQSAVVYGSSALIISAGYLLGTLITRFNLKRFSLNAIVIVGFGIMSFSMMLLFMFNELYGLHIITIVIPVFLFEAGLGFIFPPVLITCLKLFPHQAGIAAASQASCLLLLGSCFAFLFSHSQLSSLFELGMVFSSILVVQLILFVCYFRKPLASLN